MACTQLMIIEQPKQDTTMSLRSPYDHPDVVRERMVKPIAIGLTQLAKLVYSKDKK